MGDRGERLNIFVERLWRSVKYEEVYLRDYRNVPEVRKCWTNYLRFTTDQRLRSSVGLSHAAGNIFGPRAMRRSKELRPQGARAKAQGSPPASFT